MMVCRPASSGAGAGLELWDSPSARGDGPDRGGAWTSASPCAAFGPTSSSRVWRIRRFGLGRRRTSSRSRGSAASASRQSRSWPSRTRYRRPARRAGGFQEGPSPGAGSVGPDPDRHTGDGGRPSAARCGLHRPSRTRQPGTATREAGRADGRAPKAARRRSPRDGAAQAEVRTLPAEATRRDAWRQTPDTTDDRWAPSPVRPGRDPLACTAALSPMWAARVPDLGVPLPRRAETAPYFPSDGTSPRQDRGLGRPPSAPRRPRVPRPPFRRGALLCRRSAVVGVLRRSPSDDPREATEPVGRGRSRALL